VLEARARRGEFSQPVVDLIAVTEDSEPAVPRSGFAANTWRAAPSEEMADAFAVNSSLAQDEFIVADPMPASSKPIKVRFSVARRSIVMFCIIV
jgi:hypothetical protein